MRVLAPAKINLHLRVGAAKDDGYHPLLSWMCIVGLYDELTFARNELQEHRLRCDDPTLPMDASNLILKAVAAVSETIRPGEGHHVGGLDISLSKNIPAAAGMGGGSSDAARTLLALNRLWRLDRSYGELLDLAAGVGSDVPFFLNAPSAICTGRGEIVSGAGKPAIGWALLILPDIRLLTAEVYRQFDAMNLGNDRALHNPPNWRVWTGYSAMELLPLLRNDLEKPAFLLNSGLGAVRDRIESRLRRPVRMSGSGSSLFTLFDDEPSTIAAAEQIKRECGIRAVPAALAPFFFDGLSEKSQD